ncbi:hypothetical protein ACMZ5F_23165 [Streptomyces rhizosphaericola]|uniref:hypothetical protein n=1 Tax=Streptomyces rhizosphaericola TaxID=2564098 RepID=UPI0036AA9A34
MADSGDRAGPSPDGRDDDSAGHGDRDGGPGPVPDGHADDPAHLRCVLSRTTPAAPPQRS